jgi:large subunit ribosomal protein L1
MKHGKKYVAAKAMVEAKIYGIEEAVALAKKAHYAAFVGSLDLNIKTIADPKYNDQAIRGTVVLPHGNGKTVKIAAFVGDDRIDEAKAAGATIVGNTELIRSIEAGNIDFDVLVTTPDMIKDLAKVAKILWPKGIMPTPKTGTITTDLKGTIDEIQKGRIEFKLDKTGNIHVGVGKLSFDDAKLVDNINAVLNAVETLKPVVIKNKLFRKVTIAPTMWPGVQIA